MEPDTVSVVLRGLSFIALIQATGMAIFIAMFGPLLQNSLAPGQRITRLSVVIAVALLVGHYLVEAARMAGDMSGIVDPALQNMVLHSAVSAVLVIRVLGLALIATTINRCGRVCRAASVIGALTVTASFALVGHTVVDPLRWALAPLLMIHVTIVAFWFGALVPLWLTTSCESLVVAGHVTAAFSKVAIWLVPGIFVAGTLISLALIGDFADLRLPYGRLLLGKVGGFTTLMGLAALNKWRLVPAIASGNPAALRIFRRSLGAEYLLIASVLSVTAVMTALYSPES